MDLSGLLNGAEHYDYGEDMHDTAVVAHEEEEEQSSSLPVNNTAAEGSPPSSSLVAADPQSSIATTTQQQEHHTTDTALPHPSVNSSITPRPSPASSLPPANALPPSTTVTTTTAGAAAAIPPQPESESTSSSSRPIASSSSHVSHLKSSPSHSSTTQLTPPAGKKAPPKRKKKVASATPTASSSLLSSSTREADTAAAAAAFLASSGRGATTLSAAQALLNTQQQQGTSSSSSSIGTSITQALPTTSSKESTDLNYVDPDWVENTAAVIAEADSLLPQHPHLINPYLAKLSVHKANQFNYKIKQDFSSITTSNLINTANSITQWSGAALSEIMDEDILRSNNNAAAAAAAASTGGEENGTPVIAANGGLDPEVVEAVLEEKKALEANGTYPGIGAAEGTSATAAEASSSTASGAAGTSAASSAANQGPSAPLTAAEEADRLEKLEKKKASAREGWVKRRQNALEEKEKVATLEAQALGMTEEETAIHIANAIASLPTPRQRGGAAAASNATGERGDASSPAPSNASASGAPAPRKRKRAPKGQAAQAQLQAKAEAALESTPLPGSLTHENGVYPSTENGNAAASQAMSIDGQSQNGDIASTANRKRAASSESTSTAQGGGIGLSGLSANDAKRPRLAGDDGSDRLLSPSVKVEFSDAMEGGSGESPFNFSTPGAAAANGTNTTSAGVEGQLSSLAASTLPPHMRSSPAPYADSDSRQPSPAFSNTDSIRSSAVPQSQNGKGSSSNQPKEKLTGQALVDAERKVWATLARSNIPKIIRYQQQGLSSRLLFNKRLSAAAAREAKKYNTKHPKAPKDVQIKARRVMRELLLHLKGSEKTARENKRKQEKELLDKARKEEELREASRQARKLNFLITQTELYSHFVGSKLKTDEMEDSAETAGSSSANKAAASGASLIPSLAEAGTSGISKADLSAIDYDDEKNLEAHARANAQAALEATRNKTKMFDDTYNMEQKNAKENYVINEDDDDEDMSGEGGNKPDPSMSKINIDDLNFQNPQMAGDVELVKQPTMLTCQLKEYQLKGLNWLANLYEQGINGILADEMGLGKTVQSISLMAYLAEYHNIWGPFLVVAPASTLHNWQQELTKFTPALKVLPYWGNVKDRTILRKFWNRKSLRYDQNAPFHVLVTSYQLVVTDEQYFNKVKWQYMVLDEAQAIKSSASARWKILLGLNCRNRLLLTGTPIQNSMQELWALLHFIMPSLFDSHNEFSDWFSKDIEGNADKSGGMNEHQLRRLHMILKPFMLRRIKKNVQNELADKIEIDLYCDLTPRQRQMYRTLRQNISIADLVKRASSLSDDDSVKRLMNLIMQFRKVCNHPELFERADVEAPFAFCQFPQNYNLAREGNNLNVQYSTHSLLEVRVPRLLYDDSPKLDLSDTSYLSSLMNIYTSRNMSPYVDKDPAFDFESFSGLSPTALRTLARSGNPVERLAVAEEDKENAEIAAMQDKISGLPSRRLAIRGRRTLPDDPSWRYLGLPPLGRIQEQYRDYSRFNRSDMRFYIDPAQAPPAELFSSSRSFAYKQHDMRFDDNVRTALYGVPGESTGIVGKLNKSQLPLAPMEVPQLHKLILDSGKLAKLDELLIQLKAGGHRVLVYFQMTRMIDLMEEYLAFRQYKYLRLDGSSTISERRDMVTDWQTKPEIFIFLLSTRAGGLGINLTAADTVVFYDSDWNPSNDVQAMDRAHRLGQTRQVTVYRLITKGTIDERIVQLARTKKSVQDAVVGSSTQAVSATGATDQINSNEVVNLLLDDDELEETMRQNEARRAAQELKSIDNGKKGAKAREENKRAKEIAANAKASGFNSSNGWGGADDDDDAFGFFSNTSNKKYKDPDEDTEGMGGGEEEGTPAANGAANGKAKPAKGKGSRAKKANPDDPDAPPAKKRKPAAKKEPVEGELDAEGDASKKRGGGGWPKGKPRGKKLANEPTSGSFNPGAPLAVSTAASTADSSGAPTPGSSAF